MARTRWTLRIDRLLTRLAIGSATQPVLQPVRVSVTLQALADVSPGTRTDRVDLDAICAWITGDWAVSRPTAVLEARASELMEHIFRFDRRVQEVRIALVRPVGDRAGDSCIAVEREATRGQFEAQQRMSGAAPVISRPTREPGRARQRTPVTGI